MKAQIETIGLLVIIILIVVIGAIFLFFALSPSQQQDITQSTKVQNLLQAIITTNTPYNMQMKEFIATKDPDSIKTEIETIMSALKINKYTYKIYKDNQEILNFGQCTTGITASTTFRQANTPYKINLKLC